MKLNTKTAPGHLLIAEERMEQIIKHNHTLVKDRQHTEQQLVKILRYCLSPKDENWPAGFDNDEFQNNVKGKSRVERLVYAGAFIAAEIDRFRGLNDKDVPFMKML